MQRLLLKITIEHNNKPHMEELLVRAFSERDDTDNDIHNINSFVEIEPMKDGAHYHFKQVLPFGMEHDVWYNCRDYDITSIEIEFQKEERY